MGPVPLWQRMTSCAKEPQTLTLTEHQGFGFGAMKSSQHLRHRGGAPPIAAGMEVSIAAAESGRTPMGMRKKGMGVRMWLVINSAGVQRLEAGKHAIMRRTMLPARDLRILDPLLSYPSTILGRDRAIVVNLEHIKAIISAHEVLLLNSKDPLVAPFVEELRGRLPVHYDELGQQVPGDGGGGMSDTELPVGSSPLRDAESNGLVDLSLSLEAPQTSSFKFSNGHAAKGPSVLPFEFRALEACLEAACSCLDAETNALEQQAYPALDELTSKISTLNLERVRLIKSRLVAISGRVQKVRDEIEQLLDDDGDMAEMYLTDKLSRQQIDGVQSPPSEKNALEEEESAEEENAEDETEDRGLEEGKATEERKCNVKVDASEETIAALRKGDPLNRSSRSNKSSSSSHTNHPKQNLDVEELEMLLEAYFVQIDGTLNKLSTLRDYVDDTEDYINIMLDDKQNHLLQMGVMLTTATLVVSAFIVVTGVFGMNIRINLFNHGTVVQFLWVVCGSSFGSLLLYVLIIGWCRWKRLLE